MKKYRALRPFFLGKVEGKDVEVTQNEIIELPEAVGKIMVGNGWMVEVKIETKSTEANPETEGETEGETETDEAKSTEAKPKK